jgi:penicillin-binding protein 2
MKRHQTLVDNAREQRIIRIRIMLATVCIVLLSFIIIARFYYLQIREYELYQTQSQLNRVQLQKIPPPRGLIFDREQRLLAENRPTYVLALERDRINDLPAMLQTLKKLGLVDDEDITRFEKKAYTLRMFEAVPIRLNLDEKAIAKVAANRIRLEGVVIKVNLARYYPEQELLAHMLGYVGRINEKEMLTLDNDNYGGTNYIGKIGVEKGYEDILHGTVGYEHVETNARGEVLRVLERTPPVSGKNLTLHLDLDLQKIAYDAIGEGNRGAVVAIDVRTGGILAAASRPSYDPNLFVNGISFADYKGLQEDIDLPLFNRVLQAQYPPGSTTKPMALLAGLEEGIFTLDSYISDPGAYQIPGEKRLYRDWKREGHGLVGYIEAIEQSCDVYFYQLAYKMGINKMHKYYDLFGFGKLTGIDVPDERRGINPSQEWKKATGRGVWYAGDTVNIGIGQGYFIVTPLQLAYATAIIANKGERFVPQLVAKQDGIDVLPKKLEPVILKDQERWHHVTQAMKAVVHGAKGTAKIIKPGLTYEIAGKTGTAQVVGIKQGQKYDASLLAKRHHDHALFMGFAPAENPEIAVAVVVENGQHGSSTAAPVARKVMDAWMAKFAGKPQ